MRTPPVTCSRRIFRGGQALGEAACPAGFELTIIAEESDERLKVLEDAVSARCPIYNLLRDSHVALETHWRRMQQSRLAPDSTTSLAETPMPLQINFDDAVDEPGWAALNDEVMGGISSGSAAVADGRLRFAGALSLENNGGFASVRSQGRNFDVTGDNAVTLRVRGDGRRYQLRLATDARHRGVVVSFGAAFDTRAGEWIEARMPLDSLTATVRGSPVTGVQLDPSRVREIGLLIADKCEGPFLLEVDWIAAD